MPISYVDEIAVRYLTKEGYLVSQGIWYKADLKGKRVEGWSDIDIFAVKLNEPPLIIQCKSFIGTKASEKVVKDIKEWFEWAVKNITSDEKYKDLFKEKKPKKVLVVDYTVLKTEKELEKEGIIIWHYEDILRELLKNIREELDKRKKGNIGKEEDVLLRVFTSMILRKTMNDEWLNRESKLKK